MVNKAGKFWQLGLIGYPLGHSLSPQLHQAALVANGLEGTYQLFPIPPDDEWEQNLLKLFSRIRSGEITGINVTIPHKQSVISYLDTLSTTAEAVHAVNTIYMEQGKLKGTNTDVDGFIRDLYQQFPPDYQTELMGRRSAMVLGAGGSARAVVYGLVRAGWEVAIASRRPEQARELAHSLHLQSQVDVLPMTENDLEGYLSVMGDNIRLVINTTPIGMYPKVDQSPLPGTVSIPQDCFVYDLVYNPRRTKLIEETAQKGNPVSNGLGMLIEQAALSFEMWTATSANRQMMSEAVQLPGG